MNINEHQKYRRENHSGNTCLFMALKLSRINFVFCTLCDYKINITTIELLIFMEQNVCDHQLMQSIKLNTVECSHQLW